MTKANRGSLTACPNAAIARFLAWSVALLIGPAVAAQQQVADNTMAPVRDWAKVILVRESAQPDGPNLYYDRVTGQRFEHEGFRLFPNHDAPKCRFSFSEGLALVWEPGAEWDRQAGAHHGKIGYLDRSGRVAIPFRYDGADAFNNGRAWVNIGGKEGIIDQQGRWVIKPGTYPWLGYFRDGRCAFSQDEKEPKKYGFLDRDGKVVIPPLYGIANGRMGLVFREGFCLVKSENGNHVYIDRDGKSRVRLPKSWDGCFFSEGLVRVRTTPVWESDKRGPGLDVSTHEAIEICPAQWGYMGSDNKFVIPPRYGTAGDFAEGLAPVASVEDGSYTEWRELIGWHRDERELRALTQSWLDGSEIDPVVLTPPIGPRRWGFINKSGNVVIPMVYERAGHFGDGLAPVMKNDKWGYVDRTGRMVIEPQFVWGWEFEDGVAEVFLDDGTGKGTSDGRIAFIDKTGHVFLKTEIERATF